MEASPIRAYEIFRKRFSSEEAETIMAWKDESLSRWVANKEDLARVEVSLREDLANIKEEMKDSISKLEVRLTVWFVATSLATIGIVLTMLKFFF